MWQKLCHSWPCMHLKHSFSVLTIIHYMMPVFKILRCNILVIPLGWYQTRMLTKFPVFAQHYRTVSMVLMHYGCWSNRLHCWRHQHYLHCHRGDIFSTPILPNSGGIDTKFIFMSSFVCHLFACVFFLPWFSLDMFLHDVLYSCNGSRSPH